VIWKGVGVTTELEGVGATRGSVVSLAKSVLSVARPEVNTCVSVLP